MPESQATTSDARPNILVLCMDQWQRHMHVPAGVEFPAMQRLEAEGVTFDHQYCTVPICTSSRASMWTGMHGGRTGLWDDTTAIRGPTRPGPRGTVTSPGIGALVCWDGLHSLDKDWAISGALQSLTDLSGPPPKIDPVTRLREAGRKFGAPDLSRRTFLRAVVDGRYKLVRWFSPGGVRQSIHDRRTVLAWRRDAARSRQRSR